MNEKTLKQLATLFIELGYEQARKEQELKVKHDRNVRAAFVRGQMVEEQRNDDVKRALDLQAGKE